jgi:hypothetical protein
MVDTGLAAQPIMNRDPLIIKFTVILGRRSSVIKENPFG